MDLSRRHIHLKRDGITCGHTLTDHVAIGVIDIVCGLQDKFLVIRRAEACQELLVNIGQFLFTLIEDCLLRISTLLIFLNDN